ncbi:MAG: PadR family transcriptional regulator [Gemmatimonadota bacterium]
MSPTGRQHPTPEEARGGEVIKGTLDLLILRTLHVGPMHGWGITELIESGSDNLLSVNQGSLYPALYRLVRKGLLRSKWRQTENNRRARYYELTAAGREALGHERATWERLSRGVNLVLAGGPACEL